MPLLDLFGISASGLTASRLWLDITANNIANLHTAGRPNDPASPPYRRRVVVFAEKLRASLGEDQTGAASGLGGVRVAAVLADPAPPRLAYEPSHPLADPNGYVAYPNVNITNEMVNMIAATRAYEANVTVLNATKAMAQKALEIGRG
ncbi:flagellar basal body rod protein FlgC [Desulfovirgula thermocuniculi]|uniref:flagellar basal body rod protein FlgC n=1 Tax=Desulfovirgula thermocuniculi TaxID=348842 RepID=UPI000412D193|nr:flagellar basal body rod protein FlgC [Desulfovirgula thermocuniculi]